MLTCVDLELHLITQSRSNALKKMAAASGSPSLYEYELEVSEMCATIWYNFVTVHQLVINPCMVNVHEGSSSREGTSPGAANRITATSSVRAESGYHKFSSPCLTVLFEVAVKNASRARSKREMRQRMWIP